METIGRYRSYTSYSEENGKLIPSKEPFEKDAKFAVTDKLVPLETGKKILDEYEKKLKSYAEQKQSTNLPSIQAK